MQNNIFSGIGSLSNQVSAVSKTNYRSIAPGFVHRASYDLRPTANTLVINAGSAPGYSPTGVALAPVASYDHLALGMRRYSSGTVDIGAYESNAIKP